MWNSHSLHCNIQAILTTLKKKMPLPNASEMQIKVITVVLLNSYSMWLISDVPDWKLSAAKLSERTFLLTAERYQKSKD